MALTPTDITALSHLLDEALALDPEQREAWLAALPAEHQPHVARLRQMLVAQSALDTDERLSTLPKLGADEATAHAGERVGAYSLIREIGRGGMGSVWLAERADGAYQRQVALKLPRLAWGAGLAERMAREREIGALLEHPNIARMYDAGVDERGRPFLALEYIDGQPIDAWCEAQGLDVPARLRLFVQVIKAVAYAHGRLVVHRDLKPSNVLVTPDGQAHLLDFGIAKLLHDTVQGDVGLTQEQGRVLTPHYASPEQIAGEPINVASDVYSLGVLLYELLTGELPIAPKRGTLGAVEEAILQGDAPLASSRPQYEPTARALRGEVDAILAKAMQRQPGRRYATADALVQDIERHLNGETVSARPDSLGYRLRKAVRRNWVAVTGGTAVLATVLGASIVTVVQSQRLASATDREKVVKEFVADVLRTAIANDRDIRAAGSDTLNTVDAGVKLIQVRFADSTDLQAELLGLVSSVYSSMGAHAYAAGYRQVQLESLKRGNVDASVLAFAERKLAEDLFRSGKTETAAAHAEKAVALAAGNDVLASEALATLARIQLWGGKPAEAGKTLSRLESLLSGIRQETVALAWLYAGRALWHAAENRFSETPALLAKGVEIALRVEGRLSPAAIDMRLVLASQVGRRGRRAEAKSHMDAAIAALEERGGPDLVQAAYVSAEYARYLFGTKPFTYSEYMAVFTSSQRALDDSTLPVPGALRAEVDFWRGRAELDFGNLAQADAWMQRSKDLVLASNQSPMAHFYTVQALATLAQRSGKHDEAESLLLETRRQRILMGEERHPYGAWDFVNRAANFVMSGRPDLAEGALKAAPEFDRVSGVTQSDGPQKALRLAMARVVFELGDIKAARSILEDWPEKEGGFDGIDTLRVLRAQVLCAAPGQARQGLALLELEIGPANSASGLYEHGPSLAWNRALAGACALTTGDRTKAVKFAGMARAAFTAQPGVSPYYKAPLFKLERALGLRLPPV